MKNFLQIKEADFYVGEKKLISNFSINVKSKTEIICILGPSGIGKTTILRTIAGLEKLKRGSIIINGKLIASEKIHIEPENRNIALSFQDNCLFPNKNVIENIDLGLERKNRKKFKYSTQELLKIFFLESIQEKFPHEISSGEAQRVSIARSLISSPELLLLDEPFSNIDQILKEQLQKSIKKILKESEISSIIITHDPDEAFYLADKCGIIIDNSLKQFDTPYNIYHYPNSIEVVNFLKRGMLINATVIGKDKLIHDSLGIIKGKFFKKFKLGTKVKLLIQPEDLEHDDNSVLKLTVIDRQFRGINFVYLLKTPEQEIVPVSVDSHHQHQHRIDEKFGIKTPIIVDHLVCF